MLVLTSKYGSQIDLDLLKNQKDKKQYPLIKHRNDIIYLTHCKTIKEAYLTFLSNKDKYFIKYKPENWQEIHLFTKSLNYIKYFDVSWIDVSELDSLKFSFCECFNIENIIGLDTWDVSNCEDMTCMFNDCKNLESIQGISRWNVCKVYDMLCMFAGCEKLKSIDIGGWDVSNVRNMNSMFDGCKNLESIGDISGWDVSNVRAREDIFSLCFNLKDVGVLNKWK